MSSNELNTCFRNSCLFRHVGDPVKKQTETSSRGLSSKSTQWRFYIDLCRVQYFKTSVCLP